MTVTKDNIVVGGKYNWQYQPERLIYLRKVGSWNQFALIQNPDKIWCEVLDVDLEHFEATKENSDA